MLRQGADDSPGVCIGVGQGVDSFSLAGLPGAGSGCGHVSSVSFLGLERCLLTEAAAFPFREATPDAEAFVILHSIV